MEWNMNEAEDSTGEMSAPASAMSSLDPLDRQSLKQQELDQQLDELLDDRLWKKPIFAYLDDLLRPKNTFRITAKRFDEAGVGWLNSDPLKFDEHLRDRLTLIDFFTYCCVNCMHIFPHLHSLEEKLAGEDFIVIGVHSAKFENEKLGENVKNAILRHDLHHPVLNDPDLTLWNLCQIICWPTLVLLGPQGEILYKFIGEKNMDRLITYIEIFVEYFSQRNQLRNRKPLPLKPLETDLQLNELGSPGKVAVDERTGLWAVSDSANNRVLILEKCPGTTVVDMIGTGRPGLVDGSYESCQFSFPQGICFFDGGIFVADTGNHAIRKIDFAKKSVTTIVGTGRQGKDLIGGAVEGELQEISTPWDLVLYEENLLIIAMAGSHQIWAYATKADFSLFNAKRVVVKKKHCICIAGSGREENRNNSYPLRASFAQPSGLAFDEAQRILYIADSEGSAIRMMSMQDGAVKNVCGGALDPMDLFAFGDVDGQGTDVRLQHPLAVVWNPLARKLIVADSYNHKLKSVNPGQRACSTVKQVGSLKEPGGLAFYAGEKILLVTDTENHKVMGFAADDYRQLFTLGPKFQIAPDANLSQDSTDSTYPAVVDSMDFVNYEDGIKIQPNCVLRVDPILKENVALTEGAPQTCKLRGEKLNITWDHPMTVNLPAIGENVLQLTCQFVICNEKDKACKMQKVTRSLTFEPVKEGGHEAVKISIEVG